MSRNPMYTMTVGALVDTLNDLAEDDEALVYVAWVGGRYVRVTGVDRNEWGELILGVQP